MKKKRTRIDLSDMLILAGVILITVGVAMVSREVAFIVLGMWIVYFGILISYNDKDGNKHGSIR